MKTLLLADLHLTDNPLDEYRWGVFDWIKELDEEHKFDYLYILGDLTERKDRHSAQLVNRVVNSLQSLWNKNGIEVVILMGNHDHIDPSTPFFGFLGSTEHIRYVDKPLHFSEQELFLPYTENSDEDWKGVDFLKYKRIYTHLSVIGSIANNGMEMKEGLPRDHRLFKECKGHIYSGHIHKAQSIVLSNCTFDYIGSPYPVYFGDKGDWRGLIMDNKGMLSTVAHPTITRHMIEIADMKGLKKYPLKVGDQCKVRLKLHRIDYHMWEKYRDEIKEYIEKKGVQMVSLELIPDRVDVKEYSEGNNEIKLLEMTDVKLVEQFSIKENLVGTVYRSRQRVGEMK